MIIDTRSIGAHGSGIRGGVHRRLYVVTMTSLINNSFQLGGGSIQPKQPFVLLWLLVSDAKAQVGREGEGFRNLSLQGKT